MTADTEGRSWRKLLLAIPSRIRRHNVTVAAAGIAFYGLLALVPTLVATVSIYGLVNRGNEAEIKQQIEDAAGSLDLNTKEFITDQLTSITNSDGNLLALLLSVALALFSASGAVQKLMGTISLAYESDESRPGWRLRLLAYFLTAGAIVSVVTMVFLVGVLPEVLDRIELGNAATTAINVARLPVFALFFVIGLTVLYRLSPDRQRKTPWLNPGAWVATGLWLVFAFAFSVYSSNIGAMPASYGLLGTVAALMIFLQLTALAVIVGAEYNSEREGHRVRSQSGGYAPSEAVNPQDIGPVEPLPLGRALIGLAALVLLGRAGSR